MEPIQYASLFIERNYYLHHLPTPPGETLQVEKRARPFMVVLCGSTRFRNEFEEAARILGLMGHLVFSVCWFSKRDGAMTEEQEQACRELHFRKIDMADFVYVVDPPQLRCPTCKQWWSWRPSHVGDIHAPVCDCFKHLPATASRPCEKAPYIGEHTAAEIAYAKGCGKQVFYRSTDNH